VDFIFIIRTSRTVDASLDEQIVERNVLLDAHPLLNDKACELFPFQRACRGNGAHVKRDHAHTHTYSERDRDNEGNTVAICVDLRKEFTEVGNDVQEIRPLLFQAPHGNAQTCM
jgi:hypothetical protein